ncbi:hypothetical protein H2201_008887 [Coniosporium apollinis]|uniref:Pyrroline-5-carboxylate reductase catalytic N-terminal domain-containing protein n=1 Tax=Coniosporium apollinis TaxID=61459 RepID=A0ABQ9NHJ4_9PEZI|nr:hypothetical protein H2201_008887 [Coniosporium apollinis]
MPLLAAPSNESEQIGTLGTAIARGILDPLDKSTVSVEPLTATVGTEPSKRRVEEEFSQHSSRLEVLLQKDNVRAIQEADVVLFAVKPVKREDVFGTPGVREALRGKLILSIMAGISTTELKRLTGSGEQDQSPPLQVVRAMPNMAANIREAMTPYTANTETLSKENIEIASWVSNQVGHSQLIAESNFDISAVLVGCAGSLLLLAIDGLLDAAVAEGVKRPEAQNFIMKQCNRNAEVGAGRKSSKCVAREDRISWRVFDKGAVGVGEARSQIGLHGCNHDRG